MRLQWKKRRELVIVVDLAWLVELHCSSKKQCSKWIVRRGKLIMRDSKSDSDSEPAQMPHHL
jgi:hypothetical protein